MLERLRWWWKDFILKEFRKYYQVGCHCSFCGKWVDNHIGDINWAWTICEECEKKYS